MERTDLIGVVERTYDIRAGEQAWLLGIAQALHPFIEGGSGIVAFTFDATQPGRPKLSKPVTTGPEWLAEGVSQLMGAAPEGAAEHGLNAQSGFYSVRDRLRPADLPSFCDGIAAMMHDDRFRDFHGFIAADPSGIGVAGGAVLRADAKPTSEQDKARISQVAIHIGNALRLRRALGSDRAVQEAILSPSGKCLHATPAAQGAPAREALRNAARAMDRARGRIRSRDQDEALAIWRGLCSGRWSLVDRFDNDGRRFLVAHRNEPNVLDPRALTTRERQVAAYLAMGHSNKLVAYTLGLSVSTVGTHVATAMRKLGVRTRIDLIKLLARMARNSGTVSTN